MKRIKIKSKDTDAKEVIPLISDWFRQGRIIAYPTDTVYGLGCLATDEQAVKKIYRIKKRDKNKPLVVLVASKKMAEEYSYINRGQRQILNMYWPGPYTFILAGKDKLAPSLSDNRKNVAVRLPNSGFLIKMIERVAAPIVATSLNISGSQPITKVDCLDSIFIKERPDVVLDAGKIDNATPSHIWDITDEKNINIIR
jgi:L-threonylcarbamoyladenylate synthase